MQVDDILLPAPQLRPFIEGYWIRSGNYEPSKTVRVLADACSKLIFELAPTPWPSCYLVATQLSPILVTLKGRVDRIGVRFRPGMASFLLRHPLDGLSSRLTSAEDVGLSDATQVFEQLRRQRESTERAATLDDWLIGRLPHEYTETTELEVVVEVARLLRAGSSPSSIAGALGWSDRRLQRLCRRRFGASAVSLHRLHRFELVRARLQGSSAPLARLAAELGFADQAHMAREFRVFADTTISALVREQIRVGNIQDGEQWLPVLRTLQEED